ncbi:MAG: hypothetical protein A2741_00660 [Candidatus Zambryskibacteria bacterium RIFCSPHIGHO2_01_FULL_43_27]|nr:MAG: hypothetical protein A2741_00660 [Candidatus Zambryskibacteria bacterium RIFCSPHIGHO2_01_FULL_43_27]OHB00310.1 MAG: hypothetical protein A3E93_00365 [Candidatus Zambryskibacteria bacterium RIFCSPHIGHO2_12_FULL_43_12b]
MPSSSSRAESGARTETAGVSEVGIETGEDNYALEISTEKPSLMSVFFANVWKYVISLFTI